MDFDLSYPIVGILISIYMVLMGHFPFNLDTALRGIRTRGLLPESYGNWVRISGAANLLGCLFVISNLVIFAIVMFLLGTVAIVISFVSGTKF